MLLVFLALAIALPGWAADTTGQIRGTVTDTDGLSVPGVEIKLMSESMLGDKIVQTDQNGAYRATALPVGDYKVRARKPGFNPQVIEGVRVSMGGVVTLNFSLELSQGEEVILVIDEAPVVDVEKTQMGINLTAEQLRDLPSAGRDYQSAMAIAPGVVGGGNANMHGGMGNANQFYVDGVNATDPLTSTFSMNMNYDAIEELQVITGGMDAEYGRSLGGAINIVTKSGGNDFEVLASGFYADENFEVYEPRSDEEAEAKKNSDYTSQQYALNIGGPILKDKVWFFVSAQADVLRDTVFISDDFDRPTGNDPILEDLGVEVDMEGLPQRYWKSFYLFGKVTAQPTSNHRIWVQAQADPTLIDNTETYYYEDPYVLPSAETAQDQGGWLGSVGHLWMPSEALNLESQIYYQKSFINFYPILWDHCDDKGGDWSACVDEFDNGWWATNPDGYDFGAYPYASINKRQRFSANTAATWYTSFLGEHEFKAGLQYEWLSSYYVYPGLDGGGIDYYSYPDGGDPADLDSYEPDYTWRYDNDLETTITGVLSNVYIQDVWQPISRLTLRPGLRMDHSALRNDAGDVALSSVTFSPRFGFAYDVFGDAKTNFHAYYGRFVDPGFLAISDLLNTKSQGYSRYSWDDDTSDWSTDPDQSVNGTFLRAPDLQNPRSDELNVGLTRQVGENVALDITYIYEHSTNFWEDDEVNLIWNDDGTDVIGNRNGEDTAIYRIRTSDELYIDYKSLEFTTMANLDKWWFNGSYTWSKATGTSDDQIASGIWDIPNQNQFYDGYLSYDRTHAIKLNGTFRDNTAVELGSGHMGYLYGWSFRMYSGYPYRKLYFNNYYGSWANYGDTNEGDFRTPAFSQLDARAGLTTDIGPTSWALTLDCFNVLNERGVTSVSQIYGDVDGEGVYTDEDGNPLWGEPQTYQAPRRLLIGLRAEY